MVNENINGTVNGTDITVQNKEENKMTMKDIENAISEGKEVDLFKALRDDVINQAQFEILTQAQKEIQLCNEGGGAGRVVELFIENGNREYYTWTEDYEDAIKKMEQRPYEAVHAVGEGAVAQVYNYATSLITAVGLVTNMFDPASSIGFYAEDLLRDGIKDVTAAAQIDTRVRFLQEIKKAYCIKNVKGSKIASQELLPAIESITKSNFKMHRLSTLDEVCVIVRRLFTECDWDSCVELIAISKILEAVKRFYQEHGIDGTKKLPKNGLTIQYEKRLKYIKKLSKIPYHNEFNWDSGVFNSVLWKNNEAFDLEANRVGEKKRKVGPSKKDWENVLDEDGNPVFRGYVEDVASLARKEVADYAIEQIQGRVDDLMDVFMDERIRKFALEKYRGTTQDFKDFLKFVRVANSDLANHFEQATAKALERAGFDINDSMYQATLKSLKAQKSALKRDLRNTLRTGYRSENISAADISIIMLGAVLDGKNAYEDIESDFARLLDQEWAIAAIRLSEFAGFKVDRKVVSEIENCIVPEGFEVEVNEEGLCLVENEIVGEVENLNPGKYTVEEGVDGAFYATADMIDILLADINSIEAGPEQGILFQLKFGKDVSTTNLLQDMIGEKVALIEKVDNQFIKRVFRADGTLLAAYFNEVGSRMNGVIRKLTADLNGEISNGLVLTVKRNVATEEDEEIGERKSIFLTVKGKIGGIKESFKKAALDTYIRQGGKKIEETNSPEDFLAQMFGLKK